LGNGGGRKGEEHISGEEGDRLLAHDATVVENAPSHREQESLMVGELSGGASKSRGDELVAVERVGSYEPLGQHRGERSVRFFNGPSNVVVLEELHCPVSLVVENSVTVVLLNVERH